METNEMIKKGYDLYELALAFFSMTNDSFFIEYGFNWIPTEPYYSDAKRTLENKRKIKCENIELLSSCKMPDWT